MKEKRYFRDLKPINEVLVMKRVIISITLLLFVMICYGQEQDSTLSLIFTGDIMGHDGQIASAYNESTKSYSYDKVFKYIAPVISSADLAIGNLEVTLAGPPYIGYPAFSSPDELAVAVKKAGFDILVTANNHCADKGPRGLKRTIKVLDSLDIPHTGTWKNSAERDALSPLIIEKKGIRLALLNYTYGTNGIVVPPPSEVAYIDTNRMKSDIKRAHDKNADLIIVVIHWGTEYDSLPDYSQKRTAASLFRNGADVVIGSHPHVLQPMAGKASADGVQNPLVWSMGNFVSNQRTRGRDGGAMIKLNISKNRNRTVVTDAGYILTWVYLPNENGKRQFYILPCSEFEDKPDFFAYPFNYQTMKLFINDSRRLMEEMTTGFNELVKVENEWVPVSHK